MWSLLTLFAFVSAIVGAAGTSELLVRRTTDALRAKLDGQPVRYAADSVWVARSFASGFEANVRIGERDAVIFPERRGSVIVLLREGERGPHWTEAVLVHRVLVERRLLVIEREPRVTALTIHVTDPARACEAIERWLAYVPERTGYR